MPKSERKLGRYSRRPFLFGRAEAVKANLRWAVPLVMKVNDFQYLRFENQCIDGCGFIYRSFEPLHGPHSAKICAPQMITVW